MQPTLTLGSWRILAAQAAPTAWVSWVPMQLDQETTLAARPLMWLGICRPFSTSRSLPNTCARYWAKGKPRTNMTELSRSAGNTQSLWRSAKPSATGTASCPLQVP